MLAVILEATDGLLTPDWSSSFTMQECSWTVDSDEIKRADYQATQIFELYLPMNVMCVTDAFMDALRATCTARNRDGVNVLWFVERNFRALPDQLVFSMVNLNTLANSSGGMDTIIMQRPFAITQTIDLLNPSFSAPYVDEYGLPERPFLTEELAASTERAVYRLVAAVMHTNTSGGHFIAARVSDVPTDWCVYDDNNCSDAMSFSRLNSDYFCDPVKCRVTLMLYEIQPQ